METRRCNYCDVPHPNIEFKKNTDICHHGWAQMEMERRGLGYILTDVPTPPEDEENGNFDSEN